MASDLHVARAMICESDEESVSEAALRLLSREKSLLVEVERLRNGIRAHRDEKGHDRCWEDDLKLYALLPETLEANLELPPREEFLRGCARYYELRCKHKPEDAETEARRMAKDGTLGKE